MESLFIMSERQIESIDPLTLPFVLYTERRKIPNISGVYFLLKGGAVHYIGQSISLTLRWSSHGVIKQVTSLGWDESELKIAYLPCPATWLNALESRLIGKFNPDLNSSFPAPSPLPEVEAVLSEIEKEADSWARVVKQYEARLYDISLMKAEAMKLHEEVKNEIAEIHKNGIMLDAFKESLEPIKKQIAKLAKSEADELRAEVISKLFNQGFFEESKILAEAKKLVEELTQITLLRDKELHRQVARLSNESAKARVEEFSSYGLLCIIKHLAKEKSNRFQRQQ